MAANSTRMLVLGVVTMFGPANGYQLGRELMSWHVDEWANVKPGSIYSMLATLTKQGMVDSQVIPDAARSVKVYTVTDAGRADLRRLIQDGIETVAAMDPTGFRVAFNFAPLIEREHIAEWLEHRATTVVGGENGLSGAGDEILAGASAPPHVGYSLMLESRLLGAELGWLREIIALIRGGGLAFAGEPQEWWPPPDDAGWRMAEDSRRYREQLEALGAGKVKSTEAPDRT